MREIKLNCFTLLFRTFFSNGLKGVHLKEFLSDRALPELHEKVFNIF